MRGRHSRPRESILPDRVIASNVRLALGPPDVDLIDLYFERCTRAVEPGSRPLSRSEVEWILVNLEHNSAWQIRWKERETSLGRLVPWDVRSCSASDSSRGPHIRRSVASVARKSIQVTAITVVVYASIWAAGRALLPSTHHLASIMDYEVFLEQQSRSISGEAANSFSKAATALLAAEGTIAGLFPHFDKSHVDAAAGHLEDAIISSSDPFQRAEFAFFLAKACLMRGDVAQAERWLTVVSSQHVIDYRAEADAIREGLQERSVARALKYQ